MEFYKKQINELQFKVANSSAELKSEVLERQALVSLQDKIKETMKSAVQKQISLEQDIVQLKLSSENEARSKASRIPDNGRAGQQNEEMVLIQNEVKMLSISCDSKNLTIDELSEKV